MQSTKKRYFRGLLGYVVAFAIWRRVYLYSGMAGGGSDFLAVGAVPVNLLEGADAGVAFAQENSMGHSVLAEKLLALAEAEGTGGLYDERLGATVAVANHAVMKFKNFIRAVAHSGRLHLCEFVPEEAARFVVVLIVRVAAPATAVPQYGPG